MEEDPALPLRTSDKTGFIDQLVTTPIHAPPPINKPRNRLAFLNVPPHPEGEGKVLRRSTLRKRTVERKHSQHFKFKKIFGNGLLSLIDKLSSVGRENDRIR